MSSRLGFGGAMSKLEVNPWFLACNQAVGVVKNLSFERWASIDLHRLFFAAKNHGEFLHGRGINCQTPNCINQLSPKNPDFCKARLLIKPGYFWKVCGERGGVSCTCYEFSGWSNGSQEVVAQEIRLRAENLHFSWFWGWKVGIDEPPWRNHVAV